MKRRKEISQPVTRSQANPFNRIPLDLKEEILMKMKAKTISKLIFTSKSWSSIILDKVFTNMYLTRSSTQPRLLFSIQRKDIKMHVFHSCSQEDPSSDHQMVSCSPPNPGFWDDFSPPVRGLICCHNDGKVMVGNPSTCQFVTLPRVNSSKKIIFPFIGYDPVNDVYKVLCMRVACNYRGGPGGVLSKEHLVFTLGGKKKWKNIECEHYHWIRARNQGICSNGVVYYLACINKISPSLICFDLASEKFSVMELPGDVELLVNYSEKIAITNMLSDGTLDLWILEDASKQEWSKVSILVPSWTNLFMSHDRFMFRGTLGTGELIFAPWINPNPFYLLCYDLKENKARKIWIEGVGIRDSYVEVFLNHVENPMFLPKIRPWHACLPPGSRHGGSWPSQDHGPEASLKRDLRSGWWDLR